MTDADDVTSERLSPEDAFELLAHETRFGILEALNETNSSPLTFSELRRRVGVRDAGQFNYHLGKLDGRFVRGVGDGESGTDGDDDTDQNTSGYDLTAAGKRVVGAVLSGSYSKQFDADGMETEASCLECGDPMKLRFRDGGVKVSCPDCGDYTDFDVPPSAFKAWPREEIPAVVDRWLDRMHWSAEKGFCPNCDGRFDRSVCAATDDDAPEWLRGTDFEAIVGYECRRCGDSWTTVVPIVALMHPAVVAFHYEYGIDLRETPPWDLDWIRPKLATVTNQRPLRIEIPVTIEDETRVFTFDESLDVVEES